jgi:hypothetical protein
LVRAFHFDYRVTLARQGAEILPSRVVGSPLIECLFKPGHQRIPIRLGGIVQPPATDRRAHKPKVTAMVSEVGEWGVRHRAWRVLVCWQVATAQQIRKNGHNSRKIICRPLATTMLNVV